MSEQEQLETEVILQDEEGNEVIFDIIDIFDLNGKNYAVLCPKEDGYRIFCLSSRLIHYPYCFDFAL